MKDEIRKVFGETGIVAIIRGMAPNVCVKLAEAYAKGGIRLVEVTFDQTGNPDDTFRLYRRSPPPGLSCMSVQEPCLRNGSWNWRFPPVESLW